MTASHPIPPDSDWMSYAPHYAALQSERLTPNTISDWLERWSNLEKSVWEARAAVKRDRYRNAADESAERAYQAFMRDVFAPFQTATQGLMETLLAMPDFRPAPDHVQMLRRWRNEADLYRDANVALQTKINALTGAYGRQIAALTVTLDGREQTLAQAGICLRNEDRAKRETAWRALEACWRAHREALAALFLELVAQRREMARNTGLRDHHGRADFRQYRWRELNRLDYTPEDSLRLHAAIEATMVPLATRLRQEQCGKLRVDRLRPWDLNVGDTQPPLRPFADVSALEAGMSRLLAHLDPALGTLFTRMRSEGFLDLETRPGKLPGSEEWCFPKSGLPYLHLQVTGSHADLLTLLHESGHAFHDYLTLNNRRLIWNLGAPTEFEEFAAIGMTTFGETFLEKGLGGFYTPEEAARGQRESLEFIVQFLPQMALVDTFQHWVYAGEQEHITPADLDHKWRELSERYLPGVDWSGLEAEQGAGWQRITHLFTAPFYYIEYGIAHLAALLLRPRIENDTGEAFHIYREALALGNTRSLPELLACVGVRFPLDAESVQTAARILSDRLFS